MNARLRSPEIFKTNITAMFGRWRRFGICGPIYEMLEDHARPSDRGPVVRVRVVETGEEFDYRLEA